MSWYRTGTINLTKDSAIVTGVNTKWAQAVNGVMPGMIMVMPDNKFYEIKNVVTDTSLVLATPYSGATAAAQAYAVITTYEGDLSQFSARFSALLTAMGGSRADMYDWLTSTAATITISKDDGTKVPVKTLKAFSDEQATFAKKGKNADITELTGLTTPLSVTQGGTGMNVAPTPAQLRANAGLDKVKNVPQQQCNILPIFQSNARPRYVKLATLAYSPGGVSSLMLAISNAIDYGIPGNATDYINVTARGLAATTTLTSSNTPTYLQVRRMGAPSSLAYSTYGLKITSGGVELWMMTPKYFVDVFVQKMATVSSNVVYDLDNNMDPALDTEPTGIAWVAALPVYDAGNTTKASDGTLKVASPVARIASPETTIRPDIDEGNFEWCGYGVANSEAYGIEITREDIGMYRVTGAKSLASSGWRLLPPRDPDGSGDLGVVESEQDGESIIVRLFKIRMVLGKDGDIEVIKGKPIDVPVNSWIDIRLDMPKSAIPPDSPVEESQIQPE